MTFPTTGSDVHVHFTCFLVHEDTPEANGEEEDEDEDEARVAVAGRARKTEVDTSRGTTPMTSPSGITMPAMPCPFASATRSRHGRGTGSGSSIKTKVISGWEHALPTESRRASQLSVCPEAAYGAAEKDGDPTERDARVRHGAVVSTGRTSAGRRCADLKLLA